MRKNLLPLLTGAFAVAFLTGCGTTGVGISNHQNPAPAAAFSTYRSFELREITMGEPWAGQDANEKARAKIQTELDLKLKPTIDAWNANAATASGSRDTLLIEPRVHEVKFISGTARVFAGAFVGDSAIVVKVAYRDKATGELVAEPEFYQHANALGGAYSFGGTDKAMLNRMGTLIAEYTQRNYERAVGGPTGKPEPKKK